MDDIDFSAPLPPVDVETLLRDGIIMQYPVLRDAVVSTSSMGNALVIRVRAKQAHLIRHLLEGLASARVIPLNARGEPGDPHQKQFAFMDPLTVEETEDSGS